MASSLIKKPHLDDSYSIEELAHLTNSTADPIYFIENFIKVQHPTKGSIPLVLYPFQRDMIRGYHENRFVVALTSRQMGKCVAPLTEITTGDKKAPIIDIFKSSMSIKDKLITFLEIQLLRLAIQL